MPKYNRYSLRIAIKNNEDLPCSVAGCHRFRTKLCTVCRTHLARRQRWGHHAGRRFTRSELQAWERIGRAFVEENAQHPGIAVAINWLKQRLSTAYRYVEGHTVSAAVNRRLRLLEDNGVTPEDCLARAIAVKLYAESLPVEHASDEVVRRNLGHHVLRGGPLGGPILPSVRKRFGAELEDVFGVLFARIIAHQRQHARTVYELKRFDMELFVTPSSTR